VSVVAQILPPKNYELKPKRDASGDGELLEIAFGPHHPSTHGVFRMDVVLDGERVVKLKPVFGYLHRNHEKIAEGTSYLSSMPYTDRLDYFCSLTNNWAYALAVEKLAGLQVPERAEYIRVITAELTRLQNHVCLIGFLMQDMGALGTPLMYAFREREKILDLFESLTGARMMCNYMRFGGCRCDLPPGWLPQAQRVVDDRQRNHHRAFARRRRVVEGTRHQRGRDRADAARGGRELRSPQGGSLRNLRAV
jgi:NADH-quinone oxidoreductase subunit D